MITLKEKRRELFKVNVWLKEDSLKLKWQWKGQVGRGEILIWLYMSNRQLESQQMELFQANQWANQAQMANRRRFEELMMKSRLYRESHAQDCFEIEELRIICREETERARQLTDELDAQKKDEPSTVNQLLC